MSRVRVSIVQYLNTMPLVYGFTHGLLRGKYELSFTVPSQCAEALRSGEADIAIIPSIEYQRIEGLVVLPDLAIASKNEVRSLLVIAKKPIGDVRKIALDRSSRTTQAMVGILCAEHWKSAPEFVEMEPHLARMLAEADAALLIGDPALRVSIAMESAATRQPDGSTICLPEAIGLSHAADEELHVYDVVQQWRRMTGLPAVLAFWAARRETATPEVVSDFIASREYGMARIQEICAQAERELQLPKQALENYLRRNVDFSLDEENRCGLELYYRHSAELGLISLAKPVEWAPMAVGVRASVR